MKESAVTEVKVPMLIEAVPLTLSISAGTNTVVNAPPVTSTASNRSFVGSKVTSSDKEVT